MHIYYYLNNTFFLDTKNFSLWINNSEEKNSIFFDSTQEEETLFSSEDLNIKLINYNLLIKYQDKKVIVVQNFDKNIFQENIDICFIKLDFVEQLINNKISCKMILPVYNEQTYNEEYVLDFARSIMLNSLGTPKVLKYWQYILV